MVRGSSIGRCQLLLACLNTTATTYFIFIATTCFDVAAGIIVKLSLIMHIEITIIITRTFDCVSFHTEVLRLDWLHAARVRLGREEILQQLFDSGNVAFLALPGYRYGDDTLTFRNAL